MRLALATLAFLTLASLASVARAASPGGATKDKPLVFSGVSLKADSVQAEVYHDSTGATYYRLILKVNADGTLSLEGGFTVLVASSSWLTDEKRQAILTLFKAQELQAQAITRFK